MNINYMKRICICISGMVRGNFKSLSSLNTLVEKLRMKGVNVDVFLSTWSTQEVYSPGAHKMLKRNLPAEIYGLLPQNLKHIENFLELYPNFYNLISTPIYSDFDSQCLCNLSNLKKSNIENQRDFVNQHLLENSPSLFFKGTLNQVFMFYKIYDCMKLAEKYRIENRLLYDCVLRIRPDLIVKKFDVDGFLTSLKNGIINTMNIISSKRSDEILCGDILFYGNYKIMFETSLLGEYITNRKTTKLFEDNKARFCEPLLTKHIQSLNANFEKQNFLKTSLPTELAEYGMNSKLSKTESINALNSDKANLLEPWIQHFLNNWTTDKM